jgi:hypothetical protein
MSDPRSRAEILTFNMIQFGLLLMRVGTILYYLVQARRHIKHSGGNNKMNDRFTYATLIALAAAFLADLVTRSFDLTGEIAYFEDITVINDWLVENKAEIRVLKIVTRQFSYCFQNIALVFNIGRWYLLLKTLMQTL